MMSIKASAKAKTQRLYGTFEGHYHDLQAVFHRTGTHKLPSRKGSLREGGIARFLRSWIPSRYQVLTNAFAVALDGSELPLELDLVIHDSSDGPAWPLDAEGGNAVVIWESVLLVAEIKSMLKPSDFSKACTEMRKVSRHEPVPDGPTPLRILFAYRVAGKGFLEKLIESLICDSAEGVPFDAIFLLEHGAFFAPSLETLRCGLGRGLSPTLVLNDGPLQDEATIAFSENRHRHGFRSFEGSAPPDVLYALAALATYAAAGERAAQALLSACRKPEHTPIA